MKPLSPTDIEESVAQVTSWESLRGARVLLTGATGFFGKWLLATFLEANRRHRLKARILAFSRDPAAFQARHPELATEVEWLQGDIRELRAPGTHLTHVIHAATEASAKLNSEDPLAMADTIVTGTRRALEAARMAGAKDFLFTSSGAVYGPQFGPVSESCQGGPDPCQARSAYGEAKRMAENFCASFAASGLRPRVARCFAFVGPHLPLDAHFAVGNFLRDARAGGPIRILGDGTPLRSYLYAGDLAAWLWTILLTGQPMRPYNVGSDESVSVLETARAVQDVASSRGREVSIELLGHADPGKPPEAYLPNVARAREELGLAPRSSLRQSLERTWHWFDP